MEKKKSFLSHFLTIGIGTIINVIVGILTVPIITRIVDPSDYGALSMFTIYADLAVMILCLGLDQALVRFYYRNDDINYKSALLKKCYQIPFFIALPAAIIFLILVYFNIIDYQFSIYISAILVIYIFLQILNRFSMLLVRLEYKSKLYSILNATNKILYAGLVILFLYLINGYDIEILTLCMTNAVLIVTITGIIVERRIWINKDSKSVSINIKEVLKYGAPFILSMGIVTLFQSVDKIFLKIYYDDAVVGIYAGAMNLIKIFTIVQTSFNSVWAPMAIENYEKNHEDTSLYKKACSYVSLVMFLIGLVLIFGKDIFALILGSKYYEAAYILPCLIFYPIMYTISETTCVGIDFKKKAYLHIIVALVSCVVNIIGNLILVPKFAGIGAAISTGLSYVVFFLLRSVFGYKCFKVNYPFIKIGIMIIITFAYSVYVSFNSFNVLSIVLFVICFAVLCILFYKEIISGTKIIISYLKRTRRADES